MHFSSEYTCTSDHLTRKKISSTLGYQTTKQKSTIIWWIILSYSRTWRSISLVVSLSAYQRNQQFVILMDDFGYIYTRLLDTCGSAWLLNFKSNWGTEGFNCYNFVNDRWCNDEPELILFLLLKRYRSFYKDTWKWNDDTFQKWIRRALPFANLQQF